MGVFPITSASVFDEAFMHASPFNQAGRIFRSAILPTPLNCSTVQFQDRNFEKLHAFLTERFFLLMRRGSFDISRFFLSTMDFHGDFRKLPTYVIEVFFKILVKLLNRLDGIKFP